MVTLDGLSLVDLCTVHGLLIVVLGTVYDSLIKALVLCMAY